MRRSGAVSRYYSRYVVRWRSGAVAQCYSRPVL
nr:MAG TPA: hypothetical protein [Caudoviricetes sp.]